jgi:SAM-dependent methyltransferase
MFGMRENGELDPLRYDGHLDAPQEIARMFADLAPVGSCVLDVGCGTGSVSHIIADTREAKIIGIKPDPCREAAVGDPCIGEALGFVTGDHAAIPNSADRFYLG